VRVSLLALTLLLPAVVAAQGLGDAAKREREKREKEPSGLAPIFTNADLEKEEKKKPPAEGTDVTSAAEASPPRADEAADAAFSEPSDHEREERARKEREWRARFAEARARLKEAEARGWQDVVRTEFHRGIPVQMRVKEFVETEEYREAKKALADLEEEFRRTGFPPGWARE
jgi:hypothetical protein